jgi:hypothetical protein
MGLITQRNEGGAKIPPGEKLRFGIVSAVEDEGTHGPQAKLTLEVLSPGKYKGETILDWSKLSQPRTDFVKNLRNKDYSDETIAQILTERGFDFNDIGEPETALGVAWGGKLYNICMAAFHGDADTIDAYGSIDELLAALEGKSFVSITKARGADGKYTGITWDQVFVDTESSEAVGEGPDEEDFEDAPF